MTFTVSLGRLLFQLQKLPVLTREFLARRKKSFLGVVVVVVVVVVVAVVVVVDVVVVVVVVAVVVVVVVVAAADVVLNARILSNASDSNQIQNCDQCMIRTDLTYNLDKCTKMYEDLLME